MRQRERDTLNQLVNNSPQPLINRMHQLACWWRALVGGLKWGWGAREGKSRNDYSELGHDPCLALAQDRKITKLGFDHVTRCDLTGFP